MVRMRMTRSKTGNRRSRGLSKNIPSFSEEKGSAVVSHRANIAEGTYGGRACETKKGRRARVRAEKRNAAEEQTRESAKQVESVESSVSGVEAFDKTQENKKK